MAVKKEWQGVEDRLTGWFNSVLTVWDSWRQEAYRYREFYEGKQWTPEEKAELERLGQPVITVNHIWSKINSLVGLLLAQEPQIKCLPRGKHDAKVASVATSVIRYVFDINQVNSVLADVFLDMLTTGIGWVDVRVNPFLSYDPILIEYVPFDEVVFDPLARRPDLSDARFVFRIRWIERDLVIKHYPKAEKVIKRMMKEGELRAGGSVNGVASGVAGGVRGSFDRLALWFDMDRDMVLVVEAQFRDMQEEDVIWDGVQAEKYIPELHDELVRLGVVSVRRMVIPVYKRAVLIGGEVILIEDMPFSSQGFSLIPFVAYRRIDGLPLSLVSVVKDIQDEINKRRSKVLHYLQAVRVVAEEGAIVDPNQFMEELRRPDALLTFRRGMQVQIERDIEVGVQHFQLMQEAINEMSLITGIYPDFVGQPTNARTGVALRMRILQSQNSVQKYFSAMERGLKQIAERVLALVKQFYTPERIMQLVDETFDFGLGSGVEVKEDVIQVRNTLSSLRADIIVRVRPSGMTEREEQLVQLVELLKSMPPEFVMWSLDLLIDAFDIPQKEEVKKRFMALLAMQMQAQQAELQQAQGVEGGGEGGNQVEEVQA